MTQKGFIRPLSLAVIVAAIALASATGVFLYKQDKLKLTADISEPFTTEPTESFTEGLTEEMASSSTSTTEAVTGTLAAATSTASKMNLIQQAIDRINEEWAKLKAEQARQAKCLEAEDLKKQVQALCYDYTFVSVDECIEKRQKDIDLLINHITTGEGVDSYITRIQGEVSKLNQLITLKPQYESAKAECGE